jgi:hypothetical protein
MLNVSNMAPVWNDGAICNTLILAEMCINCKYAQKAAHEITQLLICSFCCSSQNTLFSSICNYYKHIWCMKLTNSVCACRFIVLPGSGNVVLTEPIYWWMLRCFTCEGSRWKQHPHARHQRITATSIITAPPQPPPSQSTPVFQSYYPSDNSVAIGILSITNVALH